MHERTVGPLAVRELVTRMSQKRILFVTVFAMLGVTIAPAVVSMHAWPREGEYSGIARLAFEQNAFYPDGSLERWWLEEPEWALTRAIVGDAFERKAILAEKGYYRVKVYGKLSRIGTYGHLLGRRCRKLTVEEVIECRYVGARPPKW